MLMQMKNTERLSLTLQRATFLGSANVRPTPQMKDKKRNTIWCCCMQVKRCLQTQNPNQQPRLRLLARLKETRPGPRGSKYAAIIDADRVRRDEGAGFGPEGSPGVEMLAAG